jgi:hypothetical protein
MAVHRFRPRDDGPAEFDCPDCGWHVISYPGVRNGRGRCLTCDWLAEHVDDSGERDRLRGIMAPRPERPDSTPHQIAVSSAFGPEGSP